LPSPLRAPRRPPGGPYVVSVIARTGEGGCCITIAFFNLPLYFARSSFEVGRKMTMSPSIGPLVPGVHAPDATVRLLPVSGSRLLRFAMPRSQPTGIVHGSR